MGNPRDIDFSDAKHGNLVFVACPVHINDNMQMCASPLKLSKALLYAKTDLFFIDIFGL